jgi:hypothetical protein
VLDIVGGEVHDTSTWYAALTAVGNIPVASMIWLEGKSFHSFGRHGLLWTDAAANLVVFALVALVFATHGLGIRGSPTSQVFEARNIQTLSVQESRLVCAAPNRAALPRGCWPYSLHS